MPVKVQCKGCEKVLNAPDKLRGKTVKCPTCKSPLKIPTGKKRKAGAGAAAGGQKKKRRRPVEEEDIGPSEDGDIFGGLDLNKAEDRKTKLCPKCATEVDPEDIECLNCGVNISTGVLSEKQRKQRKRKGPDPDEYWGRLYKDSFAFTKRHWALALKTGAMYMLLATLTICAARTCNWCYIGYVDMVVAEINDDSKISFDGTNIIIDAKKDTPVTFINKRFTKETKFPNPNTMAALPLNNPPFIFWAFMTGVFGLALAGWMWFVGTNIIRITLDGKKKVKHLEGDFFSYISLGIKAISWPVILWLPVLWLIGPLVLVSPIAVGGIGGVLALLTIPMFAVCMIHMVQPYVFKAYLLVPMLRITFRNFAATAHWAISAVLANLVLLGIVGACAALANRIGSEYTNFMTNTAKKWIAANVMAPEGMVSQYTFQELPSLFLVAMLLLLLPALITGFSTMFMMRGIGLFGRYFHGELELMTESNVGEPCGFGPRYLAAIIDSFLWPLTPILVAADRVLQMINLFSIMIIVLVALTFPPEIKGTMLPIVISVVIIVWLWTYFAVQEASYEQCTTGKNALNVIVTDMEGNRISRKVATKRLFIKWLGGIPFYGGWIMSHFDKNNQALHDKSAGTMVVWRGESEQSKL